MPFTSILCKSATKEATPTVESDLRDAYLEALYCDQDAGWCGGEADENSDVPSADWPLSSDGM